MKKLDDHKRNGQNTAKSTGTNIKSKNQNYDQRNFGLPQKKE